MKGEMTDRETLLDVGSREGVSNNQASSGAGLRASTSRTLSRLSEWRAHVNEHDGPVCQRRPLDIVQVLQYWQAG